jgi:hypothetical protein
MSTRIEKSLRHLLVSLLAGVGAVALPAAPAAAACTKVPLYLAFYECDIYGEADLREFLKAKATLDYWPNVVHATLRADVSLASPFSTDLSGVNVYPNVETLTGEFT